MERLLLRSVGMLNEWVIGGEIPLEDWPTSNKVVKKEES
jgi:hypothetical protein